MSDILTPQGLNDAETLEDSDLMEVYQDPSAGVRNNKKARLDFLRDFFKKLPAPFTPNNLVQADGTGTLKTTLLSTTEVSNTVTRSQNNESAIGVLDGRVDDNDTDIGNNASAIGVNAGDINTLELKTPQSYKISDTPTFVDLVLTGVASVANSIINLLNRVDATENAIVINDGKITDNADDIDALELKTPQSYKATDDVVFNSINTDNVAIKFKRIVATNVAGTDLFSVAHGLDSAKILFVTGSTTVGGNMSLGGYKSGEWGAKVRFDANNVISELSNLGTLEDPFNGVYTFIVVHTP